MIYGVLKIRKFPCTRSETPQKRSKKTIEAVAWKFSIKKVFKS